MIQNEAAARDRAGRISIALLDASIAAA